MLVPLIMCYRKQQQGKGMLSDNDPAKVVKEAVSKALVPYYPLAGRLRQKQGMETKLVVECNGEGIIFTEANADVTLEEFGEPLHPPFPCLDQLLFDVPGCDSVLDSPLIVMQVLTITFILA
ncbi:Benzyl alcohol O-benzoyltransferase [Bienertia sinuspersici]